MVQGVSGLGELLFCFCFFLLEFTTFVPLALVFLRFLSSVALGPGAGGWAGRTMTSSLSAVAAAMAAATTAAAVATTEAGS